MSSTFSRCSCMARKGYLPTLRQLSLASFTLIASFYILTAYFSVMTQAPRRSIITGGQHQGFDRGGYGGINSGSVSDTSKDLNVPLENKDLPTTGKWNEILKSRTKISGAQALSQGEEFPLSGRTRQSNGVSAGSNGDQRPAKFILYRLVGNDMPPMQMQGQQLFNTEFIMENESQFEDCQKKWILNRIVNQTTRNKLLGAFDRHGHGRENIIDLKIDINELADLNSKNWESSIIAQNAGRNYALDDGSASGSSWLLVFDGNIFVTDEGWRAIVASADKAERLGLKYFKVPMFRLIKIQDSAWLNKSTQYASVADYLPVMGESQIAVHRDTEARFDEKRSYGFGNKLEFIFSVCGKPVNASSPCLCGELYSEDLEDSVNKSRSFNLDIVARCGYVVRLWPHFEAGVDETRALKQSVYRGRLRAEAKTHLWNMLQEAVKLGVLPTR